MNNTIKIVEITEDHIKFNDNSTIYYTYVQDCCEYNYADFMQLQDTGIEQETFTLPLIFEKVEGQGFRFGNKGKMYFVPCYSEQDGWYNDTVDIVYNGQVVIDNLEAEIR